MPPDIGNRKCVFTKQCSRPGPGVFVLVETCLPFSGSKALHDGKHASEEAVGSEDVDEEVAVVAPVVYVDSALFRRCYPLSGDPVYPRFPSRWRGFVGRSENLHWGHSGGGRPGGHSLAGQQSDNEATRFHSSLQLHHELLDSRYHHHVPRHRMPWEMGGIVEAMLQ